MQDVLQYEIPVLHPIAVHFPIALLLAAFASGLPWLITGNPFWRNVTAVLSVIGAAGAAFAYFTGEAMEELSEDVPIVEEIVGFHETTALYTLVVGVVAAVTLVGLVWLGRARGLNVDSLAVRFVGFALVTGAAVLVAITGHAGGIMVWGVSR